MLIRDATKDDLAELVAILNDAIAHSTAVWSDELTSVEERDAWLAAKEASGLPVIIAEEDEQVVGFATFGDFRAWPGYRRTVELSIYVGSDQRRLGVGRALLSALIARAKALEKHVMIAGIEGTNEASIRLHTGAGFRLGGLLPAVGVKFDRYLDLVFMYLLLDDSTAPRDQHGP